MSEGFDLRAKVLKVDESLGLVFGWAIICKENGADYWDVQGDHIPEASMLEAAADFAKSAREAREQHDRSDAGQVAFIFPMTEDIAKQFGIETTKTGLMIAMQPDTAMLAKFKSGELTGFSIGGRRLIDDEVSG